MTKGSCLFGPSIFEKPPSPGVTFPLLRTVLTHSKTPSLWPDLPLAREAEGVLWFMRRQDSSSLPPIKWRWTPSTLKKPFGTQRILCVHRALLHAEWCTATVYCCHVLMLPMCIAQLESVCSVQNFLVFSDVFMIEMFSQMADSLLATHERYCEDTDIKHVAWHGKAWDAGIVSEYIQHGHIHTPLPSFCTAGVVCFMTQGQDFVECAFLIPKCAPVCNAQCTLRSVEFSFMYYIFDYSVLHTAPSSHLIMLSETNCCVGEYQTWETTHIHSPRQARGQPCSISLGKEACFPWRPWETTRKREVLQNTLLSLPPPPSPTPLSPFQRRGGGGRGLESRMDMWENGTPPLMGCYGNHSRQSNL